MTDLQGVGEPGPPPPPPGAATMRGPRSQPHRWSASVFPLTRPMEASPGMLNAAGRRPFSSSGPASYPQPHPSVPPSAFAPVTSGFNPVIKTPTGPPGMDMRFQQYPGPALPPPTTPPQPNPAAGIPYIPYAESPGSAHHPGAESRLPAGPRESYLETSVRLPPIHQATANPGPPMSAVPPGPPGHAYHTHRLSDPYPASWVLAGSEGSSQDPRTSAQPKRPMDSILDHPSHHRRLSSSATGSLNPIPRHLGPLELPTPVTPAPSLPAGAQTTQPVTEAEPDPRPVKRRKMALDDMVNG
ncbi:hypothetical protein N7470_003358 [Penicillium chermesinum]|nr:hypothetical protein N7470_003358 [Penicillium chermesinum]